MEGNNKERRMVNGEVIKFKYNAIIDDNYRYRGSVEN